MKSYLSVVFLLLIFLSSTIAQTTDEILAKHFKLIGQEKLLTYGQYVTKGKIYQGGMEIPFVSYHKKPNKFKSVATIRGNKFTRAFDGEKGWLLNGKDKPKVLPLEQAKGLEIQADYEGIFYNYKKKGNSVKYLGREKVDSINSFVLQLTESNGNVITAYLEPKGYKIVRTKFKTTIQGTNREFETDLSDYKVIDGVVDPFNIKTKLDGKVITHIVIDSIDYNQAVPDSIFYMPK
ncbi:hypothetical protein BMS3Abin04_01649 [bacterium BMS3Abin04]|nr:hypothetical protein BMS3Abin04_01649 [bacterium BMS3Abin04]